jgi:hypothetical protein
VSLSLGVVFVGRTSLVESAPHPPPRSKVIATVTAIAGTGPRVAAVSLAREARDPPLPRPAESRWTGAYIYSLDSCRLRATLTVLYMDRPTPPHATPFGRFTLGNPTSARIYIFLPAYRRRARTMRAFEPPPQEPTPTPISTARGPFTADTLHGRVESERSVLLRLKSFGDVVLRPLHPPKVISKTDAAAALRATRDPLPPGELLFAFVIKRSP